MKVILLKDIQNLGKKYEIKELSDGYARNYLFPNKLAKPVNESTLKWLQIQKEKEEKRAEEELRKAQEKASKIDGQEIVIPVKVGKEKQLFQSVTAKKIADKLKELGYDIKKTQIELEKPIKELGEFPVKIKFEHNLKAEIKVIVVEEE